MSKIIFVNLGDLELPSFQAHRNILPEDIQDIAESIKKIGVIEPLIIRKTDDVFEIVAGCVRYHAARLAGLKAVPCINMSLDPKAAEILKLHENVKRIPLNHIDQGHTFLMMIETFKMTEKDISEVSGMSISYISQHISLVRLGNELTDAVNDGSISFSHARELMRVDDPIERKRLLSFVKNDGATIQVLQRWVQEYLKNSTPEPSSEHISKSPSSFHNDPYLSRSCESCGKSVEISIIRNVFYCPDCHLAIKTAISEEKNRLSSKTTVKDSQDAPS